MEIDEFRTSKMCYRCEGGVLTRVEYPDPRPKLDSDATATKLRIRKSAQRRMGRRNRRQRKANAKMDATEAEQQLSQETSPSPTRNPLQAAASVFMTPHSAQSTSQQQQLPCSSQPHASERLIAFFLHSKLNSLIFSKALFFFLI